MLKRRGVKNAEQNVIKVNPSTSNLPKTVTSNVSSNKAIDQNNTDKSINGHTNSNKKDTNIKNTTASARGSITSIRSIRSNNYKSGTRASKAPPSVANGKYTGTKVDYAAGAKSTTRKSNSNKSILSRISSRFSRKNSKITLPPESKTRNLTQESKKTNGLNPTYNHSNNPTYNHSNGYFRDFLPFWYVDPSSYYHQYPYPSNCFQHYSFMRSNLSSSYIKCYDPCRPFSSTTDFFHPMNPCTAESVHILATNLAAKIVAEHKKNKTLKKISKIMSCESVSTCSKSTKNDRKAKQILKKLKEKSSCESLASSFKSNSNKKWIKKLQKVLNNNQNCDKNSFENKTVVVIEDSDSDCSDFEYQLVKVKRKK